MKHLLLALLLGCPFIVAGQTLVRVIKDTVKIQQGELELQNDTKDVKGFLFNVANGATAFKLLGKSIQFVAGDPAAPKVGDTMYVNQQLIGQGIKVWRNGRLQFRDLTDGVGINSSTGAIVFRPALQTGDRIIIESLNAVDITGAEGSGNPVPPNGPKPLYAGVYDNGDRSYVLRWTTNARSLFLSPRVLGIGSSTLAGYGLNSPDRMGDKINAWLNGNTSAPLWRNLAVAGYTSVNLLPSSDGGMTGTNIDSAVNSNPDFIFLSLASNDATAGITVNESLVNYRKIDSVAKAKGIPIFFSTTQPRTSANPAQQTLLKILADSIRANWPDRYIEAFNDVVDRTAATDAVIQAQYDNGDGTHLNTKGNQLVVDRLFDKWGQYFLFANGYKRFVVDTSNNQTTWVQMDNITDRNTVKKTYTRVTDAPLYFRVKAEMNDGSYSAYSNVAKLDAVPPPPAAYDNRILIDLGGDGVNTLNGNSAKDGLPAPSPDNQGKIWNNWYGKGGNLGFVDGSYIGGLKTITGAVTNIGMLLIGNPDNGYGSVVTRAINYTGMKVGVNDYPMEALYDNMFLYSTTPATIRLKGLSKTNSYYIKIWGGRVDSTNTTARTLEVKLGTSDWIASQKVDTRYNSALTPEYNRAIYFNNITGVDSLDLNMRAATGTGFAHVSLIDIGIMGTLPPMPKVNLRDTAVSITTLIDPSTSILFSPTISGNDTISSYQWTQVSGPNTATIASPASLSSVISGLTNGVFVFRLNIVTSTGITTYGETKVTVYPNNEGLKTLRVYFSDTKAKDIPGWMNAYGPITGKFVTYTDMVTNWTVDNASSLSTYWSAYGGGNSFDILGTSTGNNSGVVPDIALLGGWYNYSILYTTGKDNLIVSGLNPAKTYTIRMVGSRSNANSTTAPKSGVWRINGGVEWIQDAFMNTTRETKISGISPDANGKIKIAVYPNSNSSLGNLSYINTLIVQEN